MCKRCIWVTFFLTPALKKGKQEQLAAVPQRGPRKRGVPGEPLAQGSPPLEVLLPAPVPPCRKCGPRLSAAAAEKLKNRYILMRSGTRQHEQESDRRSSIPITVR